MSPLKPSIWLIVEMVGITILDSNTYYKMLNYLNFFMRRLSEFDRVIRALRPDPLTPIKLI